MATAQELKRRPEAYLPLVNALRVTLENPKYSDVTVVCGERRWRVHKLVLCPQVSVFDKACDGDWEEARTNTISLPDDRPSAVAAMLRYLYTVDYDDEKQVEDGMSSLVFNIHVHTIADKYDIPELAKVALSRFNKRAAEEWQTAGFANAAELVFAEATTVPNEFREIVVFIATRHARELNRRGDCGDCFREVVKKTPELGAALWAKQSEDVKDEDQQWETWHMCPNHGCHTRTSETQLGQAPAYTCTGCHFAFPSAEFRNQ